MCSYVHVDVIYCTCVVMYMYICGTLIVTTVKYSTDVLYKCRHVHVHVDVIHCTCVVMYM